MSLGFGRCVPCGHSRSDFTKSRAVNITDRRSPLEPFYSRHVRPGPLSSHNDVLHGYLAHKKYPPLGPYSRTMPRALRVLGEGVVSYERGTPVPRDGRARAKMRCRGTRPMQAYRGTSLIRNRHPHRTAIVP